MQKNELNSAMAELDNNREHMQKQLNTFADTDLLFFFSDKPELFVVQQQKWLPILEWAEDILKIKLNITQDLAVPDNSAIHQALSKVFLSLNDREFCCWYAASLNLRSVLLGLAFVKRRITAKEAFNLAYLEELWQNERWGEDEQAVSFRQDKLDEMSEIESFLLCEMS